MPNMSIALKKTSKYAREYAELQQDQQGAWERIKHDHDQARFVRELEDLVDMGLFVLKVWMRHAEQWHESVSQDVDRYDGETHELLRTTEQWATQATRGTVDLINHAKKWGFEVSGEREFKRIAERLLDAAAGPDEMFRDAAFDECGRSALEDHRSGKTVPIDHWGQ